MLEINFMFFLGRFSLAKQLTRCRIRFIKWVPLPPPSGQKEGGGENFGGNRVERCATLSRYLRQVERFSKVLYVPLLFPSYSYVTTYINIFNDRFYLVSQDFLSFSINRAFSSTFLNYLFASIRSSPLKV